MAKKLYLEAARLYKLAADYELAAQMYLNCTQCCEKDEYIKITKHMQEAALCYKMSENISMYLD